jgi:hypothetical protein
MICTYPILRAWRYDIDLIHLVFLVFLPWTISVVQTSYWLRLAYCRPICSRRVLETILTCIHITGYSSEMNRIYTCLRLTHSTATATAAVVDSLFMPQRRKGYLHPFHDGSLYESGVGEEIRTVCQTFACEPASLIILIIYR